MKSSLQCPYRHAKTSSGTSIKTMLQADIAYFPLNQREIIIPLEHSVGRRKGLPWKCSFVLPQASPLQPRSRDGSGMAEAGDLGPGQAAGVTFFSSGGWRGPKDLWACSAQSSLVPQGCQGYLQAPNAWSTRRGGVSSRLAPANV